jgi:hypothetical protein
VDRPRHRLAHAPQDGGEGLPRDVAERHGQEHAGLDVAQAVDVEVRQTSHHAAEVLGRLHVGGVVDDRVRRVRPPAVRGLEERAHRLPLVGPEEGLHAGGIAAAGLGLQELDGGHAESVDGS